ncbi:MAG: hypothetical protein WA634_19385 [Silvibacterium sp.]
MSGLDHLLWTLSDAGQLLLLGVLFGRRLYRTFPVFSVYIVWQVISDLLLAWILSANHGVPSHGYITAYYSFAAIADVLELGVLLEIAANVLSPARQSLQRKILYFFLGTIAVVGICAFFVAAYANAATFAHPRTFIVMDTTAAILRLITFLLVAGFSQVLGISWKNHVLQLASGLAFYSVVLLVAQLAQSRLHAGPLYNSEYQFWGHVQTCGYLCTLYFWCYAFVKKEAPRKEFSPQMTKFLVSISGSTKRQSAVLARTRDQ